MREFLIFCSGLAALSLAMASAPVSGQEPPTNDPNRDITATPSAPDATTTGRNDVNRTGTATTDNADEGFNPGWLGLIGLIGLAGLIPRDRREHHHAGTTHAGVTTPHRQA